MLVVSFINLFVHTFSNICINVPGTVLGTQLQLRLRLLEDYISSVCIEFCFLIQIDQSVNMNLKNDETRVLARNISYYGLRDV